MTVSRCEFNGAKDAGADRFDPRFDCAGPAVWHILLAADAAHLTTDGDLKVITCEEHCMNVYASMAMRHRFDPGSCGQAGARWQFAANRCGPVGWVVDKGVDEDGRIET